VIPWWPSRFSTTVFIWSQYFCTAGGALSGVDECFQVKICIRDRLAARILSPQQKRRLRFDQVELAQELPVLRHHLEEVGYLVRFEIEGRDDSLRRIILCRLRRLSHHRQRHRQQ
jgi:hypothetical protein